MKSVFLAQSVVLAATGLALFGWPAEAARVWPWTLTPLAARFVGSSFVAIAVGTVLAARRPTAASSVAVAAMDVGLLLLPASGVLGPAPGLSAPRLAVTALVAAAIGVSGLVVAWAAVRAAPHVGRPSGNARLPRPLRAFFGVHLVLVAIVGGAMFLFPSDVRDRWPWQLSVVNVRLVGSIFLGSVPLSILALRAARWADVLPTLGTYATFTALALVATAVHFALFNPARLVTWVFLALYALVAVISTAAMLLAPGASRGANAASGRRDDRDAAPAADQP